MAKIKLVIFDLDGTLINAYPAIISSFNYSMRQLKYPKLSAAVIRRAVGWGDENLLKPFLRSEDLKTALAIYRHHHKAALLKGSRLFPHVKSVLQLLKRTGCKLAVASNRPTRFSLILIRHLGIDKYFDYVLCSDKLKYGKPHPDILNRIMRKLNFRREESLYVGDMVIDAQAGRRAKVKTIIVTTGSSTRSDIAKEKPFHIISRITQLPSLL